MARPKTDVLDILDLVRSLIEPEPWMLAIAEQVRPGAFSAEESRAGLKPMEAILSSMTVIERMHLELFRAAPSRVQRVAKGSGQSEAKVIDMVSKLLAFGTVLQ